MNITGKLITICEPNEAFDQIIRLDMEHFPRPWSLGDWRSLVWKHHLLFAWESNNVAVGYVLFGYVPNDDVLHLLKIFVATNQRGSGLSAKLWNGCLEHIVKLDFKSVYLEVEIKNHRAIGFYHKHGFQELRKIRGYYSDGEDALTMQLTL